MEEQKEVDSNALSGDSREEEPEAATGRYEKCM
jgi:hypothetical protein